MGCFKITWNIFNLCYSICALIFAFESQDVPLEILSVSLFTVHIFFTFSLNGLTAKNLNESTSSFECYLLLENCLILLMTALLIIFTAESDLIVYALPFLMYISLLHIVCLCVACLSHSGYRFLQILCQKKCHKRCECGKSNSSCIRKCAQLENCLTMTISCTCCCKPKLKKKKRESVKLKEVLRKNLPKSSRSTLNFSKPSDMSLPQNKSYYKESSNILDTLKPKKKVGKQSYVQTKDGVRLVESNKKKKKTAKVQPERESIDENSFTSLPLRQQVPEVRVVKLLVVEETQNEIETPLEQEEPKLEALIECTICEQVIVKEEDSAIIAKCGHQFHSHCLRVYAKERGQRECAKCGVFYKTIEAHSPK